MSTFLFYNGGVAFSADANNALKWKAASAFSGTMIQVVERTIDFGNLPTSINGVTVTKAAADIYQLFPLMPGMMILSAGSEVITADTTGSSPTMSLGDSSSATLFSNAGIDPKAAAGTYVVAAASTWKVYNGTTPDYLKMTINTAAMTNGVMRFFAVLADVARSDQGRTTTIA
jgi:hypothetical protein